MKIRYNENLTKDEIDDINRRINLNEGYCICRLIKTPDTRCMCKEFREQESGLCHCGLYEKISE